MTHQQFRIPWPFAKKVADEVVEEIAPYCDRIEIAGSIRRRRPDVKDIEIVAIPKPGNPVPNPTPSLLDDDALLPAPHDQLYDYLRAELDREYSGWNLRENIRGGTTFGDLNKLLLRGSAWGPVAVDVFTATAANWGRDMVVRTGPFEFNTGLAMRAIKMGRRLHTYGPHAFGQGSGAINCPDEESVFKVLDLDYWKPEDRGRRLPVE